MATAAELKARLAKYATPKSTDSTPPKLESGPVAAAVPSSVPPVVVPVVRTDVQPTTLAIVERPVEVPEQLESAGEAQETDLEITNPIHQNFLQRLADLETALLARDPLMKTHLGEIHKHMIQYEEISNLLRPHEIAKIMAAQQQHTGVILRAEVAGKSKAAAGKKAAKLGVNDL